MERMKMKVAAVLVTAFGASAAWAQSSLPSGWYKDDKGVLRYDGPSQPGVPQTDAVPDAGRGSAMKDAVPDKGEGRDRVKKSGCGAVEDAQGLKGAFAEAFRKNTNGEKAAAEDVAGPILRGADAACVARESLKRLKTDWSSNDNRVDKVRQIVFRPHPDGIAVDDLEVKDSETGPALVRVSQGNAVDCYSDDKNAGEFASYKSPVPCVVPRDLGRAAKGLLMEYILEIADPRIASVHHVDSEDALILQR